MMKKITGILSALVLALALLPTTVWAGGDVAMIGDNGYGTLAEAVEAAKDGDPVVLQQGVAIGGYQKILKANNVELARHKLCHL